MDGFKLFHRLHLKNILSYGPKSEPIDLEPLNVLIGPNGSGKSNLIEAISLLKAAPSDLAAPIRAGGGATDWIWKGAGRKTETFMHLHLWTTPVESWRAAPSAVRPIMYYRLALDVRGPIPLVAVEGINWVIDGRSEHPVGDSLYLNENDEASLSASVGDSRDRQVSAFNPPGGVSLTHSVLSQIRDFSHYPEITLLAEGLSEIAFFRSIGIGRDSRLRGPQRADEPASFLLEDGRNLGVVLSDLLNQPPAKKLLLKELQRFYAPVEDITTKVYANTVETSFHERGLTQPIPSIRLSDGTLRYLALLTILCHPEPPPLVCIEDPEVGLHPDILPHLAELLIEASQRMQLIVTTHSDILVSALSQVPEAVVVCERDDEGTHLRRLDAASLDEWLKKYTLGELWITGEIGGTT